MIKVVLVLLRAQERTGLSGVKLSTNSCAVQESSRPTVSGGVLETLSTSQRSHLRRSHVKASDREGITVMLLLQLERRSI
jgi:hypothetical protein